MILPPDLFSFPQSSEPRKKVPVVRTTQGECNSKPLDKRTPRRRGEEEGREGDEEEVVGDVEVISVSNKKSSTFPSMSSSPSISLIVRCMVFLYISLSICMRGPCTAAPLLRLSILNAMQLLSATCGMIPPNASNSLTSVPFPMPPMEGLQLNAPIERKLEETKAVRAPPRADEAAASQPA